MHEAWKQCWVSERMERPYLLACLKAVFVENHIPSFEILRLFFFQLKNWRCWHIGCNLPSQRWFWLSLLVPIGAIWLINRCCPPIPKRIAVAIGHSDSYAGEQVCVPPWAAYESHWIHIYLSLPEDINLSFFHLSSYMFRFCPSMIHLKFLVFQGTMFCIQLGQSGTWITPELVEGWGWDGTWLIWPQKGREFKQRVFLDECNQTYFVCAVNLNEILVECCH